jgi:hypothetical protein
VGPSIIIARASRFDSAKTFSFKPDTFSGRGSQSKYRTWNPKTYFHYACRNEFACNCEHRRPSSRGSTEQKDRSGHAANTQAGPNW